MSRIFIFLIGMIAGWFLKDSHWGALLKTIFEPKQSTPQSISLLEEKKAPPEVDEVFVDPLEKIKGIGPAIKKKLNDQGVYTFVQLGNLTPSELEEIVGPSIKRFTDEEEVIRQAKAFAAN